MNSSYAKLIDEVKSVLGKMDVVDAPIEDYLEAMEDISYHIETSCAAAREQIKNDE